MNHTCEGLAPARKAGPSENATPRKHLDADCRATADQSAPLDQAEARRLTMHIRLRLENIAANVEQVVPMIEQARHSSVHEVLGYKSWTAYVAEEFGGQFARLTAADRRPVVELLADTGMPTRAIGSVVGVSHVTVARDLDRRRQVLHPATPEQDMAEMLAMADATENQFEKALSEARAEENLSSINVVEKLTTKKVTGLDGKVYPVPPPAPPKRRRRALSDGYFEAVYDLEKVLGRLTRLHADDRFLGSRDGLRQRHQATIERLAEELLKIEDDLGGETR